MKVELTTPEYDLVLFALGRLRWLSNLQPKTEKVLDGLTKKLIFKDRDLSKGVE